MTPSKKKVTVLSQIVKLIPGHLVDAVAKRHMAAGQCRSFSHWSHLVSLLYAQLSHSLSLNDVCDSLSGHSAALVNVRGATPPSRNGLSHANRTRPAVMAEEIFWGTLSSLMDASPGFGHGDGYSGLPRRFKRTISALDSTTIALVANCMDWAKHRRRKAAAKMHLLLNLQSFMPRFAVVSTAKGHDSTKAKLLCAGLSAGEIAVFDKAYIDFGFLGELGAKGVFWVTRAKDNMSFEAVGQHSAPKGKTLRDDRIRLTGESGARCGTARLVDSLVELNGKETRMSFLTNNLEWAPGSIADLYKSRWGIEVFFKQMKQNLQIADFLGHNENAVRWQVWVALLAYVLLRYVQHEASWRHSFSRIFTALRSALWSYRAIWDFLLFLSNGTASGAVKMRAAPEQAWLPGFG